MIVNLLKQNTLNYRYNIYSEIKIPFLQGQRAIFKTKESHAAHKPQFGQP